MRGGGLTYGLEVLDIDVGAFWIAFGEFVFETCGVVGILGDMGLVGGVFFFETMLLALLLGRGGGGRPPIFGVSRLSSVIFVADERGLGPGELDRSVVARVCSSYSSAARRLCEILIVREPSRGGVAAPPGLVDIAMLISGGRGRGSVKGREGRRGLPGGWCGVRGAGRAGLARGRMSAG